MTGITRKLKLLLFLGSNFDKVMAIKVFLLYNNHKGYTTIAENQFYSLLYRTRLKEAGDWILQKKNWLSCLPTEM